MTLAPDVVEPLQLDVSGMTCAACAGRVERALNAALDRPYEQMRRDHVAEHRRLFRRVAIDLGVTEAARLPTDERVRRFRVEGETGGIDFAALQPQEDQSGL